MIARACVCLASALLFGCASTPPSRFFTLSSAPAANAAAVTPPPSVMVGPVAIPAIVDRPEIVVTVGENEVWLDEFNRWASPLADAIALAVAEHLGSALATPRVTLLAQTSGADADYRVVIEVQRFESVPGSYGLLDAVYRVRRTADGRTVTGRTTDRETAPEKSYDALAAAHSRAVARLAGDIAQALRGLASQNP
jgi:uncharacterized lipoprotein YmbA